MFIGNSSQIYFDYTINYYTCIWDFYFFYLKDENDHDCTIISLANSSFCQ